MEINKFNFTFCIKFIKFIGMTFSIFGDAAMDQSFPKMYIPSKYGIRREGPAGGSRGVPGGSPQKGLIVCIATQFTMVFVLSAIQYSSLNIRLI